MRFAYHPGALRVRFTKNTVVHARVVENVDSSKLTVTPFAFFRAPQGPAATYRSRPVTDSVPAAQGSSPDETRAARRRGTARHQYVEGWAGLEY